MPSAEQVDERTSPGFGTRLLNTRFGQACVRVHERTQRYQPVVFFFAGVTWDALTLKRIDSWFDNLFLLAYLSLLGVLITVALVRSADAGAFRWARRLDEWMPAAIQFLLGALFSSYTVFYFQSASLTPSSLFLALLVVLLVSNEFLHRRLINLYLLPALYFLATFSFFIFFVPVVVHIMNYFTFLIGGVIALVVLFGVVLLLKRRNVFRSWAQFAAMPAMLLGLFGLLNGFYLLNWIPPVPLALRYGGIYHHVQKDDGVYRLTVEEPALQRFWNRYDRQFHYREGEAIYCFAAVFAPTALNKGIRHHWQYYDPEAHKWISADHIAYKIHGGRDNGYRGYTRKKHIFPGRWRVDVETEDGLILGRIPFEVVADNRNRTLRTVLYR